MKFAIDYHLVTAYPRLSEQSFNWLMEYLVSSTRRYVGLLMRKKRFWITLEDLLVARWKNKLLKFDIFTQTFYRFFQKTNTFNVEWKIFSVFLLLLPPTLFTFTFHPHPNPASPHSLVDSKIDRELEKKTIRRSSVWVRWSKHD